MACTIITIEWGSNWMNRRRNSARLWSIEILNFMFSVPILKCSFTWKNVGTIEDKWHFLMYVRKGIQPATEWWSEKTPKWTRTEESPWFWGGKIKYRLAVCYFLKGAFTLGVDVEGRRWEGAWIEIHRRVLIYAWGFFCLFYYLSLEFVSNWL